MTDDLDDIKAMMTDATPRPDPTRRAENLALAQENFETLQESHNAARPTPVTGPIGLWTGVKTMLNNLTSPGGLTATTAIVAVGFVTLTPVGQDLWRSATSLPGGLSGPVTEAKVDEALVRETTNADEQSGFLWDPNMEVDMNATLNGGVAGSDDARELSEETFAISPTPGLAPEVMEAPVVAVEQAPTRRTAMGQAPVRDGLADRAVPAPAADSFAQSAVPLSTVAPQAPTEPQPAPKSFGSLSSGGLDSGLRNPDSEANEAQSPEIQQILDDILHNLGEPNTEAFPVAADNPLKITQETPVSTFSIDVDTAAYSLVRNSLTRGQLPPRDAVRIEELINYFPYDYPAPDAGESPFRPTVSTFQTPWNADTQLVHIALQGQMPAVETRPPLNLVFLIDTSGSMNDPTKLPLLKQSLMLMLDQLRPDDEVAIVEYAGSAGQVLAPTPASEKGLIVAALMRLGAGGSTNGQGGLEQAYAVADAMAEEGEVSRVLLATDGDFNVGINNPDALKDFIADKRDTGTYLSVLGFGRGNLDDATMQALAQNGNGTAAYIDTLSEAQKVLVDQLTGALFTIAGDVKIQVEWNPAEIAEYRLIGYETRALNREDFNNDAVDAGELGAGHSVTAIYEITPVGSPAQLSDPLRYQPAEVAETNGELGFLKLRYKDPGDDVSQLLETPITANTGASNDARFAAAIAGFGQLLRDNPSLGAWSYADAIALANANRGRDDFGYRTEAVQLMRLAQSLSN